MSSLTNTHTLLFQATKHLHQTHAVLFQSAYQNMPPCHFYLSFVLNHQLLQQVSWSTCITPATSMPNKMTQDLTPSAMVSIPITIKTFPSSKATSAEAAFLFVPFCRFAKHQRQKLHKMHKTLMIT